MRKKFFILTTILFILISTICGCSSERKTELENRKIDAGWNFAIQNNLFNECSIEIKGLKNFKITQFYYDGLRAFVILKYDDTEQYNFSKDNFFILSNDDIIFPNWYLTDNDKIYMAFNCVNLSQNIKVGVTANETKYVSDGFKFNDYEKEIIMPNESFEELTITKVEIAEHSLLVSGTITGYIDVSSVQIEQKPNWVCGSHSFEKNIISDGKFEFTTIFSIMDKGNKKYNLICNDANGNVSAVIPFELGDGS